MNINNNIKNLLPFMLILVSIKAGACEYCNKKFAEEITSGERQNTIVAKEMLLAMHNQSASSYKANPVKQDVIELIKLGGTMLIPPTGYVPQDAKPDVRVSIELSEGEVYMGNGVFFKGFTTNGKIPGPTIIVDEGDVVEFTVVNNGNIPHGASIHSAYTQTSKYLGKIPPGQTAKMVFRVTYPGVYLYHCAPGGHAIPMHIIFGQYGMMVVRPKKKYKLEEALNKKPDVEIFLTQHEWYANGKDAIESKPMYVTFNGKIFRYVEEPIKARPNDYVRIHFLNAGPNLISTFHIVGIIWDFVYWQGHPDAYFQGGQSVLAGPTDSWTIEFRMPPDEGAYTMLSHAVGSTDRGAIGLLMCDNKAPTPVTVMSDGPEYADAEKDLLQEKRVRTISPFEPASEDVDRWAEYGPETKEVIVSIIGNSFYPKRIKVAKGTTVKWINEEVFTYMEGEFSGIHNTVTIEGPENWASPLLTHAESFNVLLNKTGKYIYICTPHPYMKGEIMVTDHASAPKSKASFGFAVILLSIILFLLLVVMLFVILKFK